ncbi:MAG: epimerase, partial [Planctomycetota bacterium]
MAAPIRIDREGDLGELEQAVKNGKTWDAVIDNSGYVPAHVTATAELLKDAAQRYVFISTISVYGSIPEAGIDETFRVTDTDDEQAAKVTKIREVGALYGPLKYRCEVAAEAAMPGRAAVLRPGLIAGPGDPTDRFTYWPVRTGMVERCGGKMLVPGANGAAQKIQMIDARDLAAFCLQACNEEVAGGVYNLVADPESLGEAVKGGKSAVAESAEPELVSMEFLATQPVAFWQELPAVLPTDGAMGGMSAVSNA